MQRFGPFFYVFLVAQGKKKCSAPIILGAQRRRRNGRKTERSQEQQGEEPKAHFVAFFLADLNVDLYVRPNGGKDEGGDFLFRLFPWLAELPLAKGCQGPTVASLTRRDAGC